MSQDSFHEPKSSAKKKPRATPTLTSWSAYFERSKNLPPPKLLENAIKLVVDRDKALDVGAGSMKDSKYMLSVGFKQVVAIDHDANIKTYRDKIPAKLLKVVVSPIEEFPIRPNSYNFISAQYSIFFTSPPHFEKVVKKIVAGLKPYGIFCAQFLGPNDSWNDGENPLSVVTKTELKKMLAGLDLIFFNEKEVDGTTLDGKRKHWHLLEVIALNKPLKLAPHKRSLKKTRRK